MRSFFIRMSKKALVSFLLLLQLLQVVAQSWSVGKYTVFSNHLAHTPLRIVSRGLTTLNTVAFVSRVGGVSFDGVAAPAAGTSVSDIDFHYNADAADGARLEITVNNVTYSGGLPDWQMVPIARYANSLYTACVTLFGDQTNRSYEHIQYHTSFQNSLLGMRILQSDIMLINPVEYHQVFQLDGRDILGAGETRPDESKAEKAAKEIEMLILLYAQSGKGYDSYVLTDAGVKVRFSADASSFSLTGEPYYRFFKYGDNNTVLPSTEMNAAFKRIFDNLSEMNPLVYDAVTNTMRYAAFFRYFKQRYPAKWQSFLQSIADVRPRPQVTTPTAMPKP